MGKRRTRAVAVGLAAVVVLAVVGWVAGRGIRSPAEVAAGVAPPQPSLITVPVVRRTLATEVIVRGTVRYGSPQSVTLPTSSLRSGTELVSQAPLPNARLREGSVALSVSGRPVFVLRGDLPAHRDLAPGREGVDVMQLEQALARLGFSPGAIDGRYDGATAAAVAAWYSRAGWTPFGVSDAQRDQLRSAQVAAAQANDALLQTMLALQIAARGATPAEIAQARTDVVTAADGVDTALQGVTSARIKLQSARNAALDAVGGAREQLTAATRSLADVKSVNAQAVAISAAAVKAAEADLVSARATLADDLRLELIDCGTNKPTINRDTSPECRSAAQRVLQDQQTIVRAEGSLESARIALGQAEANAAQAENQARAQVASAQRSLDLATERARTDSPRASPDVRLAAEELSRARLALATARRLEALAASRLRSLRSHADTRIQAEIVAAAQKERSRTQADVARLAALAGVQIPAGEVLFFPVLPLRVDTVTARRGEPVSGAAMTVSNSRIAIDSSLSINDARLVRVGMPVVIEEPDLRIKLTGRVTRIANKPGTIPTDPQRVYFEVTPRSAPPALVGASVRLAIAVSSTRGAVLAVPVSALSVVADGTSRVQVDRGQGRTVFVTVVPGLAAQGLVEVRPVGGRLRAGDQVVVGVGAVAVATPGGAAPAPAPVPAPTTTAPPAGTPVPAPSGAPGG